MFGLWSIKTNYSTVIMHWSERCNQNQQSKGVVYDQHKTVKQIC